MAKFWGSQHSVLLYVLTVHCGSEIPTFGCCPPGRLVLSLWECVIPASCSHEKSQDQRLRLQMQNGVIYPLPMWGPLTCLLVSCLVTHLCVFSTRLTKLSRPSLDWERAFTEKEDWVWKQKPQIQVQCFVYLLSKHPPRAYFVLGADLQPSAFINSFDFTTPKCRVADYLFLLLRWWGRWGREADLNPALTSLMLSSPLPALGWIKHLRFSHLSFTFLTWKKWPWKQELRGFTVFAKSDMKALVSTNGLCKGQVQLL